jgi:hypothetical protein
MSGTDNHNQMHTDDLNPNQLNDGGSHPEQFPNLPPTPTQEPV